jgi:signal transduction histidine kinase
LSFRDHIIPPSGWMPGSVFRALTILGLILLSKPDCLAQSQSTGRGLQTKRVLMVFGDSRDLPGNVILEQAVRAEMLSLSTNRIEFFAESLDATRFPDPKYYRLFRDYIKNRYSEQHLDMAMLFMSRDFVLAQEMSEVLATNLPLLIVAANDLSAPTLPHGRPFTGVFRQFDIAGTMKFIFRLQPDTRRVVVIGGVSTADQITLERVADLARSVVGVEFEFWTNRPVAECCKSVASLQQGTVVLLTTVQRDVAGQTFYTSQIVHMLTSTASVPVYVLAEGLIGGGALGGNVIDLEGVGTDAGKLALEALAGTPVSRIPFEVRSNGVPTVDWRVLQKWGIKKSRLPIDCVVRYRPHSVWDEHRALILSAGAVVLAQAVTIAALLVQRKQRRRAEAEILQKRMELAHVARVSTMGQLASALTHELNQPLAAILRNTEAAEIFLQRPQPDLDEVRAILADIRKDEQRAGNVIDHMRSLFKRRQMVFDALDLRELVEDSIALLRPDAVARQIQLTAVISPHLPEAQGDRVHVQQVLLNLMLNGMDAMSGIPRARRSLIVRVTEATNGNLQVAVSDHGSGVAPDDAAHVFEPFFTTKPNGMGMGLAISRTIIEAHGGDIGMESNATEGTTFTFTLPRMKNQMQKEGSLQTAGPTLN